MNTTKNLRTIIGMIMILVTTNVLFTSCELYPMDEEFRSGTFDPEYREQIITISIDAEYTGIVHRFAENNSDFFILELTSADNQFLGIQMRSYNGNSYYNEATPSARVFTLLDKELAREEIRYQNANTKGYNFSEHIDPVVYNNSYVWRSRCSKTNAILLIYGVKRVDIRSDYFWGSYSMDYEFISETAVWFHRDWSNNSWNFQLRK